MDTHKNARLAPKGREEMVRAVVDRGMSNAAAARQFNTDAWLAVCRLCEALTKSDSEEPVSKWRDAINKTQAWFDAMR